ncbi:short-chain dehydrogenase/reductase family 16C member 6-like [Brevipalpus obovatus]|uniref:short-chain dehydrogenase/reductase family 16C member 6-like n=1 Tax=Brevipalpus obovatus TaxID=246614 RepID=UPI003D9DB3C5
MAKITPKMRSRLNLIGEIFTLIGAVLLIYVKSLVDLVIGKKEKDLRGLVALVTGAGHGLGRELSLELAHQGCKVALLDINQANCDAVQREIKGIRGIARSYKCDVTNKESIAKVFKTVQNDLGKVDILVNNAGITHCRPYDQLTEAHIVKTFQVNTFSHFWTIQASLSGMLEKGSGHIVAISSIAGLLGTANCVDYCASKFAIVGLMESLEKEIHQNGKFEDIHFTTICPLIMSTGMFQFPKTRFSSIFPICTAFYAAKQVVKAIKRNDSRITIPRSAILFHRLSAIVPTEAASKLQAWFDYGVESHD